MGFFKKFKKIGKLTATLGLSSKKFRKALKKVVKVAAPIAAGMIPVVGGTLQNVLTQALNKPKEIEQPQAAEPEMGPEPNVDLAAMQSGIWANAREPQPVAYAGPRAAAFQAPIQAGERARRLMGIARGVGRRAEGPIGQRIRLARVTKHVMAKPSKDRLRARFDRGPALHSVTGGAFGSTAKREVVDRLRARLKGRATMPQVRRSPRPSTRRTPRQPIRARGRRRTRRAA